LRRTGPTIMTIRSISAIPLTMPFDIGGPKPMLAGKPREMEMLLIRVETDAGLVGWGEGFGFAIWPATKTVIETLVAPQAVGRDERDICALMNDLQRRFHLLGRSGPVMYALSGLDIALWDLAGKAAGRPLAELLGGMRRDSVPAYASLMRYTDPDVIARNAARAVGEGYGMIKLHELGVEQVRRAREAIGPDVRLTVDTNCPWTADEAIAMARAMHEYDLHWLEEPIFPPEDHAALARVRRESGVPIAAGENAAGYLEFQAMIDAGAVDYFQPSVTKIGGVSGLMRVAALAGRGGARLAPHSPYVGPGLLATVHVLAALQEEIELEYCYCTIDVNPLGDAVLARNARVAVPKGPGLGRDPDPAMMARCAIR
jgi:L-alanine-DL-glutamate epimerase-like enolase superfamily enzyme